MRNVAELIERYVAVWNEADAGERRRRIEALWAPDGATCHRLLDARGWHAIHSRVTASWEKWLRGGNYMFEAKRATGHNDAVKFDWVMLKVPQRTVEAAGLSYLLLDAEGRLRADYQFNPTLDEARAFAERCVALWNEPDAEERRRKVAELWTPDGAQVSARGVKIGHGAIEDGAATTHAAAIAAGSVFVVGTRSQAHHDVASLTWQRRGVDSGKTAAAGAELLILDKNGKIRFGYQFEEPMGDDAEQSDG
ncbi:MAG TPA: hypothetical protein VLX85_07765 [Stellaceae bacterium]|nr:hypothetical protein [Stellaceae bacterium]